MSMDNLPTMIPLDAVDTPLDPRAFLPAPAATTVLGVAPGSSSRGAALCAVRCDAHLVSPGDALFGEAPLWETHYTILGAERLPAGTDYPAVARRANTLARRLYDRDSRGDYHVLVDATGAGVPVVELIHQSIIPQAHVTAVALTPGDTADPSILWRSATTVGVAYLVSRLQAVLQGRRLHAPAGDARVADLLDGLASYEATPDPREADGLVVALALAASSDYQPIRYGVSANLLPSARL